jgi:hypothetical protein
LRATVAIPPQDLGYGFSVWSVAGLGAHLEKQNLVKVTLQVR